MNYRKLFIVEPGKKVDLSGIDPRFSADHKNKASMKAEMAGFMEKLSRLQYLLYAENERSLLICLQALDAGGKDGTIRHVFEAFNPQGTRVHGFRTPTQEEAEHDFLWRIHREAPKKGEVAIFNRSHYEDVLFARVHRVVPKEVWSKRFGAIVDFEKDLAANGTKVIKFFLYISPAEQLRRFGQRLEDPARHWKISEADYAERDHWDEYMKAYAEALARTSTKQAPWFIIPSDRKWFRNLAVSGIVADVMESMKLKAPKPTVDLGAIRKEYHAASEEGGPGKGKKKERDKKGAPEKVQAESKKGDGKKRATKKRK